MRSRRTAGAVAGVAMALALAAPATADTGLIQVATTGKLKPAKKVSYLVGCSANCSLTARLTLKLKHGRLGPVTVGPEQFAAGGLGKPYLVLNKPAKKALKNSPKSAKLITTIDAVDLTTGATDTVHRTFKFKRK